MNRQENSPTIPTILIVEDDSAVSQTIADTLEAANLNEGYQIVSASSLQETQDVLRKIPPQDLSLLILDVGLPDGNGETILINLRGNPKYNNTGVIVTSGFSLNEPDQKYRNLGADIFLPKPWELLKFTSAVSEFRKRQT